MKKYSLAFIAVAALCLGVCSAVCAVEPPETFELINGLKVILSPVENVDSVCVLMYHLTGSRYDPPEIFGASYLYQTLMLGATQSFDPMEGVNYIRRYGGDNDAQVSFDYSYFQHAAPEAELGNVLWYESERISSLKVTDASIDLLRNILLNRYSLLEKTSSMHRHVAWVRSRLFAGTVYESPVYGDVKKLMEASYKDIKDVYQRFNNPSDMILVITGNFNAWETKEIITKRFGSLGGGRKSARRRLADVPLQTGYIYENRIEDGLSQPFVIYGLRSPARTDIEFLYFEMVRAFLLDPRIAKLRDAIVRINNLDVSVDCEFTDHIGMNGLIIKLSSPRRIDLEKAKFIVNNQLQMLAGTDKVLSANEVRDVKSLMELDFFKNIRDLKKRALMLAEAYVLTGTPDLSSWLTRIRRLSAWDGVRVRKCFAKENLIILNALPKS